VSEDQTWFSGHFPPPQLLALCNGEPRPDTVEIQIMHGEVKAFGAHGAARTKFPGTSQILWMVREKWSGLALAGCLPKPVQRTRSLPDAGA
jgi:hypothetical protein